MIDRGQTRVLNRVGGLANPWKRKSNTVPDQFLYIDSIYIVEILSELKEKLKCNLIEFKDIEITIEVNPGTVDTKKLNDYKKLE